MEASVFDMAKTEKGQTWPETLSLLGRGSWVRAGLDPIRFQSQTGPWGVGVAGETYLSLFTDITPRGSPVSDTQ